MKVLKTGLSILALLGMTGQGFAAVTCDSGAAAALKTAAVQQELMVAALSCGATDSYNHFVLAFRPDLQKSDAALMNYFKSRDGSEAGYDAYKTKLANLSAQRSSRDGAGYCAAAAATFSAGAQHGQTLGGFIAGQKLLIAAPESCAVKYDIADIRGVPPHALPANPYGVPASAAPANSRTDRAGSSAPSEPPMARRYQTSDEALPRPPRWRHDDDDAWNHSYGPPPGWLPRPSRRERYQRSSYDGE